MSEQGIKIESRGKCIDCNYHYRFDLLPPVTRRLRTKKEKAESVVVYDYSGVECWRQFINLETRFTEG